METATQSTISKVLPVTGMSCAACAVSVESMLAAQEGVQEAGVNFASSSVKVVFDPAKIDTAAMQQVIRSIGYDLIIDEENATEKQEAIQASSYKQLQKKTLAAALLTIPVAVIGMIFMDMPYGNYIMWALTTPVLFVFGRSFFINAWKQAKMGKANMDTLVALSTGIAYVFSVFNTLNPHYWHSRGLHAHVYFEASAVVIVFIMIGKLLEQRAKSNTSAAIKKLIGMQPKTVWIIQNGEPVEVPAAQVQPGDIILVRSGEKIPVDGIVEEGESYVDESMISGEPVAVHKTAGAQVFTGTINQKGSFRFKAQKVGSETMLANIIKMVQEAQGSKAPVQKLVDKIAGIFVPIVIVIAIAAFAVWVIAGGENAVTHGMLALVTVLVIACPCALGLATPTAIMVGVGKGAEHGILIRDAESLELGHKVNAIVLDKTGTITAGKPVVTDMIWKSEAKPMQPELENILLSAEQQSEHPLATAVVQYLKDRNATPVTLSSFESITGKGILAQHGNITYKAGSYKMAKEDNMNIPAELRSAADQWSNEAKTVIVFAQDNEVLAILAIADEVKAGSKKAVEALKQMGIDVYMFTGDNQQTAAAVAAQVGIQNFKAEALPADKANFVKSLQEQGKVVAMVGDGINDSQALAQADISIAMGKGSDIAIDTAGMSLISSDLQQIPKALALSRSTVRAIRQNLFWAFIYNLIGIPLAAGILYPVNGFLLNPMIAGAAMALSSVSVIGNSLRLKWQKF
ncbi:heavy metal translocating P-type ATPase [Pseudoflavitalea sp. G-6-1-2]|uniref:heavy metal translocating P-type ATPase n=1 Tax=Pseudoflavitalea sp. G-6-1-2 TaxID=2728841 RepID=UPI00197D3ECB|nr:heavy metal translocating P-type ATPase [Pseudoflavitalea sp. G-6-1-2]